MADGNPLLAVYYRETSTIRVYEFLNGAFVQIGTNSGFTVQEANSSSPPITPKLYWSNNGQRLFFPRKTGRTGQVISVLPSALGAVTVTSNPYSFSTTTDAKFSFSQGVDTVFFTAPETSSYGVVQHKIDSSGLSGVTRRHDFTSAVLGVAAAPDGSYFICARANNSILIGQRTAFAANGTGTYTTANINIGGPTSSAKWFNDSQAAIIVDSTKTLATVYSPNGLGLDRVQTLPSHGTINEIAMSGDGRTIAISYNNAGVMSTRLFKTYGKFVIEQDVVFNNFGTSLAFTGDGLHLIDALTKVMYSFDGQTWTRNISAIAAVTAGGSAQGVSNHIPNEINVSKLYNGAIGKFIDGYSGLDLRLHLLTNAAAFSATQTSIDQFDPAVIIGRGDLPDYGIKLTLSKNEAGANYFVSAPGVTHPVTSTFITTHYAVVYDFNSKKPLIFYDFGSDRIIPVGTRLFISFRDDHLLTFGP